jgi:hypothetical protein
VRLLLGARAGTEQADRAGFRPLDLALRNGHSNSEVVALLTQKAQAHAEHAATVHAATVVSPRAALAAASSTREEHPSPPDASAPSPTPAPTPTPTRARAPAPASACSHGDTGLGGVVLYAGLYSPVRSTRLSRVFASPGGAEGEGEGEGEAALPELLSLVRLLGLGDAAAARLARRGALDLAAVSRLPLRECAAAANIPMAGASELVTLAQQACSADASRSHGVPSTGRAVEAACRACFDLPLLRLLETSHVRRCASLVPRRSVVAHTPAPCTCALLRRAAPPLLAAGVRSAASLARFATADLKALGVEAEVATALCRAARQLQSSEQLTSSAAAGRARRSTAWQEEEKEEEEEKGQQHLRFPAAAVAAAVAAAAAAAFPQGQPQQQQQQAEVELKDLSQRRARRTLPDESRAAASGDGQQQAAAPAPATTFEVWSMLCAATAGVCGACGERCDGPQSLQRHKDLRRQYGSCVAAGAALVPPPPPPGTTTTPHTHRHPLSLAPIALQPRTGYLAPRTPQPSFARLHLHAVVRAYAITLTHPHAPCAGAASHDRRSD